MYVKSADVGQFLFGTDNVGGYCECWRMKKVKAREEEMSIAEDSVLHGRRRRRKFGKLCRFPQNYFPSFGCDIK
jgi:hypothetical protein